MNRRNFETRNTARRDDGKSLSFLSEADEPIIINNMDSKNVTNDAMFEDFWQKFLTGFQSEKQSQPNSETDFLRKVNAIKNRIKLNQLLLDSTKQKMKKINFQKERKNVEEMQEKLFTIKGDKLNEEGTQEEKELRHKEEMQALRMTKPNRELFLKSCPGISNFHETVETTLSMLTLVQNVNGENYEQTLQNLNQELDLKVIYPPNQGFFRDDEE